MRKLHIGWKCAACVCIPFAIIAVTLAIKDQFALRLHWAGWINLFGLGLLSTWYSVDACFARREVYSAFDRLEPPISHTVRFIRRILTLTVAIGGLGAFSVAISVDSSALNLTDTQVAQVIAGQLVVLTAAYLASIGWMYTRFEQDRSERSKATLEAIRDQMYGSAITSAYADMVKLSGHYRQVTGLDKYAPLPLDAMKTRLDETDWRLKISGKGGTTLEDAAVRYFNALNQLALGVRQGQFDLTTIKLVLRPRFVRTAARFFEFVKQKTGARWDADSGRYRARRRTLEHFLWLLVHLDVLGDQRDEDGELITEGDRVQFEHLVLPPKHIIGSRSGEKLEPPRLPRITFLDLR